MLYKVPNYDGFIYRKTYTNRAGITTLSCRVAICKVTVLVADIMVTNPDGSFGRVLAGGTDVFEAHRHTARDDAAREMDFREACRKRAREESLPLKQIFDEQMDL